MSNAFGLIVIGDEILSGRRRDRHFDGIGGVLRERGFDLAWLRILPDDPAYLVAEFVRTMGEGIPVFSCGGIGATPDDHTRGCAARAAGVPVVRHPQALAAIEGRFGDQAYPHRVRMADLPQGCTLIPNPYNQIPGFSIRDHHFLPGFPDMAHPMAVWVLDQYYPQGGEAERRCALRVHGVSESSLMDLMTTLVEQYPDAGLFSLPRLGEQRQIELGFKGRGDLDAPIDALCAALQRRGVRYERLDD